MKTKHIPIAFTYYYIIIFFIFKKKSIYTHTHKSARVI